MRPVPPLVIPETLNPQHADLLRGHRFESAGTVAHVLSDDEYDGIRALYAITNPAKTAVVYVGESEAGRDIRGRIKAHMNARDKAGNIEADSLVFVHVMVTEYMVLDAFEHATGGLPLLNHHKTMKHALHPGRKLNGGSPVRAILARRAEAKAEREAKAAAKAAATAKADTKPAPVATSKPEKPRKRG